ncbi:unnamed protein product [Arabidopsis halleri]
MMDPSTSLYTWKASEWVNQLMMHINKFLYCVLSLSFSF